MPLYPQKCSLHPSSRKILYATGGNYILINGKKSKGCYGAYVGLSVKILKLSLEKGESKIWTFTGFQYSHWCETILYMSWIAGEIILY